MKNQTAKSLKDKAIELLRAEKLPQALKKAQLGIKKYPGDCDFQALAGFILTEMKQYKRSIPHFVEASRMKPDDPQFAENLANALMQTGQIERALAYAEQKFEKFPNNKELARVIEEISLKGSNWRSIIDYASQKLMHDPNNADLLINRARAFAKIGFEDENARDVARAFELAPENPAVAFAKALVLHQGGDKDGSDALLNGILVEDPSHKNALLQLSTIVDKSKASELLNKVEAAMDASDEDLQELQFAKAHLMSKVEGLDAALPYFAKANATQHSTNPYHFAAEEKKFAAITALFPDREHLVSSDMAETPTPIFVIGQPRSGTTLMEMMLSAAPNITGCGELTLAADLSVDFQDGERNFDSDAARHIAQEFRNLMPPIPADTTAFVDKMPHNFQRVGFILSAFPNAKVINMLRDPRDVGLSKWIRRFPAGGMNYASNLKSIAHSANLYRRYMAHWDAVFTDRILTVPYEKLVADPESYSKEIAAFCEIEWHPLMVRPEDNTKQVRTASVDQVRSKISTKSIGGWRNVVEHIQPMLDGLDPQLWPEYDID
ncbi:MAG: sulfotransferase [Pseudomonadota bacterium]